MKIGFTGSQHGMSENQKKELSALILDFQGYSEPEFHHGDCIGADFEAANIMSLYFQTHAHPPSDPKKRAFHKSDVIYPPEPYLIRNRRIVDATQFLIAAPRLPEDQDPRSGTWATIRYAKKLGRKVIELKR